MRSFLPLFFVLLIGCFKPSTQTAKPQPKEADSQTPKNTQEAPKIAIKSMVTLGGNITETVFALGQGSRVVGVDASSLYPPEATKRAQVGYYRQVSAEGILSLAPELVLASASAGPADVLKKVVDVGVRLETVPAKKTLKGAKERIQSIAKILGEEAQGQKLIQAIDSQIASIKKPQKTLKVLFVYARGAGSLNVAGTATAADEMIQLAGATNAVQDYEGYKPINAESIVAAKPDVVLLTTRGLQSIGGIDAVIKLKGIDLTPAAKNKDIVAIDDLLLLGFGPRTGDGVVALAAKLNDAANREIEP